MSDSPASPANFQLPGTINWYSSNCIKTSILAKRIQWNPTIYLRSIFWLQGVFYLTHKTQFWLFKFLSVFPKDDRHSPPLPFRMAHSRIIHIQYKNKKAPLTFKNCIFRCVMILWHVLRNLSLLPITLLRCANIIRWHFF